MNPHACARELASVAEAAGIPLKAGLMRIFMTRKIDLAVQELLIRNFCREALQSALPYFVIAEHDFISVHQ